MRRFIAITLPARPKEDPITLFSVLGFERTRVIMDILGSKFPQMCPQKCEFMLVFEDHYRFFWTVKRNQNSSQAIVPSKTMPATRT